MKLFCRIVCQIFILNFMAMPCSYAQETVRERERSYFQFQKEQVEFDKERVSGKKQRERELAKQAELDEKARLAYIREQNKNKKNDPENTAEYRSYLKQKKQQELDRLKVQKAYEKQMKKRSQQSRQRVTEEMELGLNQQKPRYDYNERSMYSSQNRSGSRSSGFSSGAGSSGRGSGAGVPSFQPTQNRGGSLPAEEADFEEDAGGDFDEGDIPPPPPPSEFFEPDLPPPPPPMDVDTEEPALF